MMKISQKNATKWVSLMESTERKLTKTTFINEAEKPVINQEQLQEFDRKLKKAVMNNLDVEITYYVDNSFQTILSQVKSRSEEHTSELQSRGHLVCRLLLEKKKKT